MAEKRLVEKFKKRLVREGAYVNKNHGGPHSLGRPDLEGCLRGLYFAIEVKDVGKTKQVTERQESQLRAIRRADGFAVVTDNIMTVEKLIGLIHRKADTREKGGG